MNRNIFLCIVLAFFLATISSGPALAQEGGRYASCMAWIDESSGKGKFLIHTSAFKIEAEGMSQKNILSNLRSDFIGHLQPDYGKISDAGCMLSESLYQAEDNIQSEVGYGRNDGRVIRKTSWTPAGDAAIEKKHYSNSANNATSKSPVPKDQPLSLSRSTTSRMSSGTSPTKAKISKPTSTPRQTQPDTPRFISLERPGNTPRECPAEHLTTCARGYYGWYHDKETAIAHGREDAKTWVRDACAKAGKRGLGLNDPRWIVTPDCRTGQEGWTTDLHTVYWCEVTVRGICSAK